MNVTEILSNRLNLQDALDLLVPLSFYVLAIAGYGVLVFKYYRFVAARDMFALDLSRYEGSRHGLARSLLHVILYVFKYLILFPVFAFFWFAVLTLVLAFLSKGQSFSETLLIAVATVSAIRVAAYYNEDLSRDLAKILPFAVMGVFLIDASFFSISDSLNTLNEASDYNEHILYYLLFLIALEFVLRIAVGVVSLFGRGRERKENVAAAERESVQVAPEAKGDESPGAP
ncbi:MAG: hypothetical protein OYI31_06340 [Chloroflexota bacterium]|nr:hypothetical protein [Chloroflexota bacterium]MDE2941568.1 hypothetical protein [Chloroflexota bacterium]MDE3268049.1 hypothetical protein [Chloroflexota bacterium]